MGKITLLTVRARLYAAEDVHILEKIARRLMSGCGILFIGYPYDYELTKNRSTVLEYSSTVLHYAYCFNLIHDGILHCETV